MVWKKPKYTLIIEIKSYCVNIYFDQHFVVKCETFVVNSAALINKVTLPKLTNLLLIITIFSGTSIILVRHFDYFYLRPCLLR